MEILNSEMEVLRMDDDREDGRWMCRESYYSKKRRRVTKEDAFYGVFADHPDSDSSESKRRRERESRRSDLSLQLQEEGKGGDTVAMASFEKHTRGIGSKLLKQMGYEGGGLGKDRQGILAPIEPDFRPKAMGLGFIDDCKESESEKKKPRRSRSKKARRIRNKKKEMEEKSLAKKQERAVYGPQVRVLANLGEEKARENDVRLIVGDFAAELDDIEKIDRDLSRNEMEASLGLHKGKEEKLQNNEVKRHPKKQHDARDQILSLLNRVAEEKALGTLTLDSLAKCFGDLHRRFPEEYKLLNLSCIAYWHFLPLFIGMFQGWDPLQNPLHGFEVVSLWKTLLEGQEYLDMWEAGTPYTQLMTEVISSSVRVSGTSIWEDLMRRFIVPKLQLVLQELDVEPAAHQDLSEFEPVIRWASVIPLRLMVELIERFFSTRWLQVLHHWLCSDPDFDEVRKWFLGWRDLLPKELLGNGSIQKQLEVGLDMMSKAAEGLEVVQPGLGGYVSYHRALKQMQFECQQRAAAVARRAAAEGATELNMTEVVEVYAQQHHLLFKPKPGRVRNGLQIYGFGNVSVIIDSSNERVFAQTEEKWKLVTMEDLLKLHNRSLT